MGSYTAVIGLGVVSGIAASLFVWFFSACWKGLLVPWYRKQVYQGVVVVGEWTLVEYLDDNSDETSIEKATKTISHCLNIESQYGHHISGWFSQEYREKNSARSGRYNVKGRVVDGNMILSLTPVDKKKPTFGTILLSVGAAGKILHGIYTYKSAISNKITSKDLEMERQQ